MNTQRLKNLQQQKGYHILPVKPGHMLELYEKVGEGNNIRTQKFKGLVIKVKKKNQFDGSFIIRGKSAGHTVEKIYPLSFPKFEKVLVLDIYKVRRAKLYFIRDKVGKGARFPSIATAEEKGVDLLELARAEADSQIPTEELAEEMSEEVADQILEQSEETQEQNESQQEESEEQA